MLQVGKIKPFNDYIIKQDENCEFYIHSKNGEFTVNVDKEDLDRLIEFNHSWSIHYLNGFGIMAIVRTKTNSGKTIVKGLYLHRWILNVENSKIHVDHINHDPCDNRKQNLRITDHTHNGMNRKAKNINNKSGYRNVRWDKQRNKWSVFLQINKKNTWLGSFDDVKEAGKHAELMRQKYYGEFAGKN